MTEDRRVLPWVFISTCILGWMLGAVNGDTDQTDVAALNAMFTGMNSPSQLGWSANGGDPCGGQPWKGITCSGNRVSEIKLPNLRLSGSFGYQLQTMTSVTDLDMSHNNFGTIPYQLPPNLQRLDLSNNQYSGSIPYSISDMTSLTYLSFAHNQLQNALSDVFQRLSKLDTLDLSFNSMSGSLPQGLSSLTSLNSLYLQNNQFTGTIDVLANLPLDTLNVENNHFTGWIPEQLKGINLQTSGNTWNSGPAPPPPPGTPPATTRNPHHKSDGSNNPSDDGTSSDGRKKSGIGGEVVVFLRDEGHNCDRAMTIGKTVESDIRVNESV